MALEINEIIRMAKDDDGNKLQTIDTKGMVVQTAMTLTTTSAASAAVAHKLVEIYSDVACYISFDGTAATTADYFFAAGERLTFEMEIGTAINARSVV
jgi:hypothetical protein